jgi:glyoxylate reductase
MRRIVFTRKWPGKAVSLLEEAGFQVDVRPDFDAPTESELISIVSEGPFAIVTTVEDPVTARVVESATEDLEIIAQAGVGYDNVDHEAAGRRGIWTSNTPGVLDEATADLAFSLLCATARQIPQSDRYVREGHWTCWHPSLFLGPEFFQSTVGVVGFGRIGQAFARRCTGFDMTILYNATAPKETDVRDAEFCDLDELLERADFVSLHVPLNPSTDQLIDAEKLGLMKSSALLVNTARGRVVDTDALVEALADGSIAGAGLDVTDPEPLPADHALLDLKNVVVTPHVGSASHKARMRMADMAARNILAVSTGDAPPNAVAPIERQ